MNLKKNLNLFLLIWLVTNSITGHAKSNLIPYRDGNKWGFADTSCKVVIKPKYEAVSFFDLSLDKKNYYARVRSKGMWGIIDSTGKLVIPTKYDSIGSYIPDEKSTNKMDLLYVRINNKIGLISMDGEVKLPLDFDELDCAWSFIDGNEIRRCYCQKGDLFFMFSGNKLELIPVTKQIYSNRHNEGIEFILTEDNFIDQNFCQDTAHIYPLKYDSIVEINYFDYSYIKVYAMGKVGLTTNQRIYSNPASPMLVGLLYDEIHEIQISSDVIYLLVSINGKWGIVDYCGQIIVPIKYDQINNWSEYGAITTLNEKKGAIRNELRWTRSGNAPPVLVKQIEILNKYDTIRFDYVNSNSYFYLWWVEFNGKGGYVDYLGREYFKN